MDVVNNEQTMSKRGRLGQEEDQAGAEMAQVADK
jgi:hypothetical protein